MKQIIFPITVLSVTNHYLHAQCDPQAVESACKSHLDMDRYFTGEGWDHSTMTATTGILHSIKFSPMKTGTYYIRFSFVSDQAFCGMSVVGFSFARGQITVGIGISKLAWYW